MGYPPEFYYRNSGRKLPNARAVSSAIHGGTDRPFRRVTTMVMQFGQFLDHDLTLTPEMNLCREKCPAAEMEIDCCLFVGKGQVPKSCYPIAVPDDDHDFHSRDPAAPRCLDLKRSQPAVCNYTEGEEHTREQFNVLTAFVDGSQVNLRIHCPVCKIPTFVVLFRFTVATTSWLARFAPSPRECCG